MYVRLKYVLGCNDSIHSQDQCSETLGTERKFKEEITIKRAKLPIQRFECNLNRSFKLLAVG